MAPREAVWRDGNKGIVDVQETWTHVLPLTEPQFLPVQSGAFKRPTKVVVKARWDYTTLPFLPICIDSLGKVGTSSIVLPVILIRELEENYTIVN